MIEIIHGDCMDYMRDLPDNAFDLAIVDPPYGIGFDGDSTLGNNKSAKWQNPKKCDRYQKKKWDSERPASMYFDELFRVSQNQIIWGGNYFADMIPVSGGWVVWSKGVAEGMSLSDAELAWVSSKNNIKIIELLWSGFRKCEVTERFHPTQKPVKLYEWLLNNYAEKGQRILDTHLGSGSSAIAAHYFGCDFVGIELDEDYYMAAKERIERETSQISMF